MFESLKKKRNEKSEGGFTLIELLVVIAILGILAAIVVFSVSGINDKGQLASCKIDTQTLQTAEEANFAQNSTYVTMSTLQSNGFLSTLSSWHDVTLNPSGGPVPSYYVIEKTPAPGSTNPCGLPGDAVNNQVPTGATAPAGSAACSNLPQAGAHSATQAGWGDC